MSNSSSAPTDQTSDHHSKQLLKFELVQSLVDHEFWYDLENKKLLEYKLDNKPKQIQASYNTGKIFNSQVLNATHHANDQVNLSSKLRLGENAFTSTTTTINTDTNTNTSNDDNNTKDGNDNTNNNTITNNNNTYYSNGTLYNANTIEEFNNYDKKSILRNVGLETIYEKIVNQEWLKNPNELTHFLLLTFADLKQHAFHYWFAFPSLSLPDMEIKYEKTEILNQDFQLKLQNELNLFKLKHKKEEFGFYLIIEKENSMIEVKSLSEFKNLKENEKYYLGFSDPSALNEYPSWILRNYLLASYLTFKKDLFNVIAFRQDQSLLLKNIKITTSINSSIENLNELKDKISVIGWEKNNKNKLGPKFTNMGSTMNPLKLAESSVTLNLQLMKWRMFPTLNLEKLGSTKCLLIGSGTLGCHVARNLMAWGIFNITFVDRTRVSFSNPVRQPLYEYEDCLNGGKDKASCAAEHLRKIYPNVNVQSHSLDIPMPGHFIAANDRQKTLESYNKLNDLIESHDVVYLLTDTRESRWLPSLIAIRKKKIIINAALGFESYLVMRYGVYGNINDINNDANVSDTTISGKDVESEINEFKDTVNNKRLGCYFCNDVVAPVNSTKDRTLDQQCTVTRPGVSAIAGTLAVELLVSLSHHPEYKYANAYNPTSHTNNTVESDLGVVPHQIRGSISNYQTNLLYGSSYNQCTCCSPIVLENYIRDDFNFLERCFNDSKYLEELTGLKQLHEQTLKLLQDFDYSSEEEEEEEEKASSTPNHDDENIQQDNKKECEKEQVEEVLYSEMSKEALIEKIKQLEQQLRNKTATTTTASKKATPQQDDEDDLDGFEVL